MESLPSLFTFATKIVPAKLDLNLQLINIRSSLDGVIPEIFLVILFCVLLLAEILFRKNPDQTRRNSFLQNIALVGCLMTFALVFAQWNDRASFRFEPLLFLDHQAVFFKLMIITAWFFTLVHVRVLKYDFPAEFNALIVSVVLGLHLLTMSTHFLTIYLSLELVSISSYLLVAISPYKKAAEGGIKYLLFGAASSAVMLYGISFIYGISGTLDITNEALTSGLINNSNLVVTGTIILTLGGLLFKLSLVPFHVWTPDVYESAPTPLISFLSVAPKAAVVLVLLRLASIMPGQFLPIIGGMGLVSMTIGNISALWQTNARRLLAYSSIAQAGYLIVGVVAYSQFGFESAVFYTAGYLILNMAAFFLIDLLNPDSETKLSDFEGLGKTNMWISGILTVIMVGLAGLPPTVGFTSKLLIFSSLWESYLNRENSWILWLLIGGILNAAISLAYYLRLPYLLFFKKQESVGIGFKKSYHILTGRVVAGVLLVTVIALFVKPELLLQWINRF